MSKYEPLWHWIKENGTDSFKLTYAEIEKITGMPIDHSFITYKKELLEYGYMVGKISMKEQTVSFEKKIYQYKTRIHLVPDKGGAYVEFPYDIRTEFGRGRVKVHVTFDGIPYDGSIVNMGIKNANGDVCYIIGLLKSIREKLGKSEGDEIEVTVCER